MKYFGQDVKECDTLRLCLVPVKYFPENIYFPEMLFSGKKNVFKLFGCLKICFTENQFRCLVRSNIFTENALHSQATQFSIHFLSCKHDNESIPHSFTKETKPSKKWNKIRSNWDCVAEEKVRSEARSSGAVLRSTSGAVLRSTIGAVRSSDWSSVCGRRRSLFSLSLCDLGSLSLLFAWVFSFCGSLSLLRVLRKMFEGKTIM